MFGVNDAQEIAGLRILRVQLMGGLQIFQRFFGLLLLPADDAQMKECRLQFGIKVNRVLKSLGRAFVIQFLRQQRTIFIL